MTSPTKLLLLLTKASVLLLNVSCTLQRPSDLRLETVYIANWTSIASYKQNVQEGFVQPVGLVIELSSEETYTYGAFVLDGFCGEEKGISLLGDGYLYELSGQDRRNIGDGTRHRYFALADIRSRHVRSAPNLPDFNLEDDGRDLCLQTSSGEGYVGWESNTVRVPRALIDQALREGVKPLPKIDNQF
jgi:hypothetical protein